MKIRLGFFAICCTAMLFSASLFAQGVTTGAMNGLVVDTSGEALPGANVVAVHDHSGTQYGTAVRTGGAFTIPNMRVGGPYTITVSFIGYKSLVQKDVFISLGQNLRLDFKMSEEALAMQEIEVTAEQNKILNSDRTGAATFISTDQVTQLPSVNRSTKDLVRLDPRNDGNLSFAGRNWLYNSISVDGSYFNNPFGLDDPSPGGQSKAEPIPFDAVEQVQVSVAPFDVRQSGFTGANINSVTKSGSNELKASAYSFVRNEDLLGNTIKGNEVNANPDLSFNQSGFTLSGPIIQNKLFFFVNGELERRDDVGTNFLANTDATQSFGESRVDATTLQRISDRLRDVYGYETGPFQDYIHETNNEKLLLKLDWNINENNNLMFRYNFLDARREQGPHPFVLSANQSGRGPNESSLPFKNSGYRINNELHSFVAELNSRSSNWANRFFASYNQFRDFRQPFSAPFPTVEIAENGQTYTTAGHEPFSIHNILDQDVLQVTNNFSLFSGRHVLTLGTSFESYSFFNSFNIFRHGIFFLPDALDFIGGTTFSSLDDFFRRTNPGPDGIANTADDPADFYDFNSLIGTGPFKGEEIDVGQLAFYVQDEFLASDKLSLTYGLRVDLPMYFTDPVENPFSTSLSLLDKDGDAETVNQASLPGASPLYSPRVGFNWDINGDRSTQLRGGTGIFTGRVPFVWIGNVISNPGNNPNLFPTVAAADVPGSHKTSDDSILQQSFDLNAMDPDFKWPQIWNTNIAVDKKLPWNLLGTLEVLYGKDLNAVVVRNADLKVNTTTKIAGSDGRPYYGGVGANELNSFFPGSGEGVYVIDNTNAGYNINLTAQLRKQFDFGLNASLSYSFTEAKNKFKSTEIASVLFSESPVQGNPNRPNTSYSEFGNRHRIVGGGMYSHKWSKSMATHFGLFFEVAEGNTFNGKGGNRYSYTYAGDVNGDGFSNDLIYIPTDATSSSEIRFVDTATQTAAQQAQAFEAFIKQDDYLSSNRGKIAERFGAANPWFSNIDLRILQDFSIDVGSKAHLFQVSLDVLNVGNLISGGEWGVRKVASSSATTPLKLVDMQDDANGDKVPGFNFVGPDKTFINDPGLRSRWQIQLGVKYLFN